MKWKRERLHSCSCLKKPLMESGIGSPSPLLVLSFSTALLSLSLHLISNSFPLLLLSKFILSPLHLPKHSCETVGSPLPPLPPLSFLKRSPHQTHFCAALLRTPTLQKTPPLSPLLLSLLSTVASHITPGPPLCVPLPSSSPPRFPPPLLTTTAATERALSSLLALATLFLLPSSLLFPSTLRSVSLSLPSSLS